MPGRISLRQGADFHGHLGPYLVLGIMAGELALRQLKCRKHFGIEVTVRGADKKPQSCLIDGLQLSTGATYGKGNIRKLDGSVIRVEFCNRANRKKIGLRLKSNIIQGLKEAKTHQAAEGLARKIYKARPEDLFITR